MFKTFDNYGITNLYQRQFAQFNFKLIQAMAEQGPTRDPSPTMGKISLVPDQLLAINCGKRILNVSACHL